MEINIYKVEDSNRFNISISRGEDGFQFNLTIDELKTLHNEISKELEKVKKEKNVIVWNPRSRRHEIVKK